MEKKKSKKEEFSSEKSSDIELEESKSEESGESESKHGVLKKGELRKYKSTVLTKDGKYNKTIKTEYIAKGTSRGRPSTPTSRIISGMKSMSDDELAKLEKYMNNIKNSRI